MDGEQRLELLRLCNRAQDAAETLHTLSEEFYQMAKELEELTNHTRMRHSGIQARVEAAVTRNQAKDLRQALEELGKSLRGERP
jgi:thioredoxin-like negative regulator of GroEL